MSSKIVTMFMVVLTLIISACLMTTFRFVGVQRNQDMAQTRVETSVVSTDGEISADSNIIMTKADIVESVKYNEQISSQIQRLGLAGSEIHKLRKISYFGTELTPENVSTSLPEGRYIVTYDETQISIRPA